MQLLESHGTSGGERNDAVDFCLTGISKLTHEVKDASSYLPAYDQRTYSEASETDNSIPLLLFPSCHSVHVSNHASRP